MGLTLAPAAAFGISAWLTWRFARPDSLGFVLDRPGARSLHQQPTPRGGELAMLVALLVCAPWPLMSAPVDRSCWIGVGLVLLAPVAYLDDRGHVPARYRLLMQAAAACCLVAGGLVPRGLSFPGVTWDWPAWVAVALTVLFVVWMVNLYNFMDGMDGFAGGMTVFGFGTLALLGWQAGAGGYAGLAWIIAACAAGFLLFNFPPARIFMGDVGSTLLGFLAAALILWGVQDTIFPLWVGILAFSPFVIDATVTLFCRLLRRERVWEAHRAHYYQRLVLLGWGQRRTVLWAYGLMVLCGASALLAQRLPMAAQWGLIGAWGLLYATLMWTVDRLDWQER